MVALAQRRKRFAVGLSLTFLPIILWIVLPVVLFVKLALLVRIDERLVEAYSFIVGALFQLVAIYFFENARQKPRDWLSICAVTADVVSLLSVLVYFGAASAVVLRGW
jgi:hypothetical protein